MIPSRGLRIASLRGINVYLHWSWFIVFFLLLWVVTRFLSAGTVSGPAVYIPMAVATTLLFFISVLLHELSHSVVANRNGIPIRRITLFVFGGGAQMDREVTSPGVEFKMAVAGPLCSYALSLVFGGTSYLAHALGAGTISFGLMLLAAVNFGLGTFNLIPGFPLDGGRVLRALLWHHWRDLERSTRAASRMGQAVGGALVLAGVAMLVLDSSRAEYDLLFSSAWFMLVGAFLIQAAYTANRQVRMRASLAEASVRDLTRAGVPALDASTSLEEAYLTQLRRSPAAQIPVLRQGRLAAAVTLADLKAVAPAAWADTPLSRVARPVDPSHTVRPDADLYEALQHMRRAGREFLWVVEDGRLAGVLLAGDARRAAGRRGK